MTPTVLHLAPVTDAEACAVLVLDDVLPDPIAYRDAALAQTFQDVCIGPATFKGIAFAPETALGTIIAASGPGLLPTLSFFRQSPEGQVEPNYIHTDLDMGEWTAILYLTLDPPDEDGTAFWRWTKTGAVASTSGATSKANQREWLAWRDRAQWACWARVPARFNRLVMFPAAYFHSRAMPDNYGRGAEARLTQVLFGTGRLT